MTGWIALRWRCHRHRPEVALKAIAAETAGDPTRYLLIGDRDCVLRLNQKSGLNLPLKNFSITATPAGSSSRIHCRTTAENCPPVHPLPRTLPSRHCVMAPNAASA